MKRQFPTILSRSVVRASRRLRAVAACCLTGLGVATVSLGTGCGRGDDRNTYAAPPPPEVIVANPVRRDVVAYATYTGVVEASESVELRARVQGFLERIEFEPGQRVSQGDLLFVIDKRQYQAAVERAEAQLRSREAALEGAENDARLARELADQRAGPEIDALIKAARRDSMAADVAAAEAELFEARLNLEFCEVRAPIDGRITVNEVDIGNLVGRGEPTLLARIIQGTPAFVSVDISEADVLAVRRQRLGAADNDNIEMGKVASGQWRPSQLSLTGDESFTIEGIVDYVQPELDLQTGTLRVRTRYDNTDESLLPGFFARVRFAIESRDSLLVPEAALLRDQQGRFAMVVNANDEVEVRRVKIGILDGAMRVVEEGLTPQDRVIVLGVLRARPGSKVTPKTQQPAPGAP